MRFKQHLIMITGFAQRLALPVALAPWWGLVGGTRQRHFAGTRFKPRKLLKNTASPISRVHAGLGVIVAIRMEPSRIADRFQRKLSSIRKAYCKCAQ
jgi:hypothetical protein